MNDLPAIERDIETLVGTPLPARGTREHLRYLQQVQNTRPDLADAYFALTRQSDAATPTTPPPSSLTRQLNLSRWHDRLEAWRSALLQRPSLAGKKVPDKRKFWLIAGSVGALSLVGFFAMSATPSKKAEGPNLLGGIAGNDVRGNAGADAAAGMSKVNSSSGAPSQTRTGDPATGSAPTPETVNAALVLPVGSPREKVSSPPTGQSSPSALGIPPSDAPPRYGVTSAPPYATANTPNRLADPSAQSQTPSSAQRAGSDTAGSQRFSALAARDTNAQTAPGSAGLPVRVVAARPATPNTSGVASSPLSSPSLPTALPTALSNAPLPGTPISATPLAPSGPAAQRSGMVTTPATAGVSRSVSIPSPATAGFRAGGLPGRTSSPLALAPIPVPPTSTSSLTATPSTTPTRANFMRTGGAGNTTSVQSVSVVSGSSFMRVGALPVAVPPVSAPMTQVAPAVQPPIAVPAPMSMAAPAPPPVSSALGAPGLELLVPGVTIGSRIVATMMTTVIAVENGTSPLVAQTTREGCDAPPCAPIVWIGEAFLGQDKRVHARITRAVVGEREVMVKGQALGADLGPGIVADIRDEAATLVMDLLRGGISAFGDYLGAAVSQKTTTVISGGAVQSTNLPSLSDFFLGKIGQLFSLGANPSPTFVRVARIEQGASFTVLYGIEPSLAPPSK